MLTATVYDFRSLEAGAGEAETAATEKKGASK